MTNYGTSQNPIAALQTNKAKLKKEIKAKKDVKSIRIYSSRDKIMSLGGNSAELIKIK